LSRPRVLVADDDVEFLELVRERLEAIDVDVDTTHDGHDAAQLTRVRTYDACVLDQWMQGLTGLELAERLLAAQPNQRIVLVTGYLDDVVSRRAAELGVTACVDKIAVEDLATMLREWLARTHEERS
jgi:CheY-like chemotaxis protein